MTRPNLRDRDLALLKKTFSGFPWIAEVRLFGSRATGVARRASDIDLAISAPTATADQWLELVEAIEETPIILEFDIVRLDGLTNQRLLGKIDRDGVVIFGSAVAAVGQPVV